MTEKTDAYADNLRVGLELWEKQLSLGAEVEGWAGAQLALFAQNRAFHRQQDVSDMKVTGALGTPENTPSFADFADLQEEICKHEETVERLHKRSVEIQEMLQSQEAPLELQVGGCFPGPGPWGVCAGAAFTPSPGKVVEGQLRKRLQQVKELFGDCAEVFQELTAVRAHLAQRVQECRSAVENIQSSLTEADASEPNVEVQIQVGGSEPALASFPRPGSSKRTSPGFPLSRTCAGSWRLRRSRRRQC